MPSITSYCMLRRCLAPRLPMRSWVLVPRTEGKWKMDPGFCPSAGIIQRLSPWDWTAAVLGEPLFPAAFIFLLINQILETHHRNVLELLDQSTRDQSLNHAFILSWFWKLKNWGLRVGMLINFLYFLNLFLFYVYECMYECVYACMNVYMPGACGDKERLPDPLELELVVSHHVGAVKWTANLLQEHQILLSGEPSFQLSGWYLLRAMRRPLSQL